MTSRQVKTKKRVVDHGEVFTADREVNAMLDLVKQETERIDSRFLEPACGDGNFLVEILRRKLVVVKRKYAKSPLDYEKNSVLAVSSIYGVDILMDNVISCRERLFSIWDEEYKAVCRKDVNEDCRKSVLFILSRNILCGDALNLKYVDEVGNDTNQPIVFSEWAFVTGFNIQRSDYTFDKLLEGNQEGRDLFKKSEEAVSHDKSNQISIFEQSAQIKKNPTNDEGELLRKYISNYRRLWEYAE